MSGPRNLPQSKEALLKSYQSRLKDDVRSMLENFEGKGVVTFIQLRLCLEFTVILSSFFRNYQTSKRRK